MSSLKLLHSGGNGVIIAAPSSNPAANRTITLNDTYAGDASFVTANSSGNVGLGTASPSFKLTVSSAENNLFLKQNSGDHGYILDVNQGDGSLAFNRRSSGSDTERMRIDASGNIKIGETNSSTVRLSLTQGSNGGIMISQGSGTTPTNGQTIGDIGFSSYSDSQTNSSSEAMIRAVAAGDHSGSSAPTNLLFFTKSTSTGPGSSPTERMKLDSSGDLRVGRIYSNTTSGGANVRVQSDGLLQRDTSSRRYKNTITDATHGLADLKKLRPVTYKGNNDGDTIFGGLIAEEVHDAGLTEFVDYDSDNQPDALKYGNMVSLCIKAIQELSAKLETLQTKVAALEGA